MHFQIHVFQGMNACTVPLTDFLQIGQSTIAGAQETQQTRCPQGRNMIPTTAEKQILQVSFAIMSLKFISTGECAMSSPVEDIVGCCELFMSVLVFRSCPCMLLAQM